MQREYDTPEAIELYLELASGTATIEAVETTTTEIEVTGPHADEFDVDYSGRVVRVISPKYKMSFMGSSRGHVVAVKLPTSSDLTVKTGSADLLASGEYDEVNLKTGSGDIELDAATTAGIETGSGDIRVSEVEGDLRLKSGSGDVEVGTVGGATAISTGSGDTELGRGAGAVAVKTGSGDIVVNRAGSDVVLTSGSGDLRVGHTQRGKVTFKTASGDVHVGVVAGTPVWSDVHTVTGSVRSRIDSAGKPAEGQEYVELRANTVSGDVFLEQV